MTDEAEIKLVRDTTLQRIGRNVLDLQTMERMLKFLLVIASVGAPISQLDAHVRKRFEKFEMMTMGQLIEEAANVLFVPQSPIAEALPELDEPSPWFELNIEGGPEAMNAWRDEMSAVRHESKRFLEYQPKNVMIRMS